MTAPTDQQILEEAIQKAIDGGWNPYGTPLRFNWYNHDRTGSVYFGYWNDIQRNLTNGNLPLDGYSAIPKVDEIKATDFLFNHDFAKALWGDTDGYVSTQNLVLPTEDAQYATNGWKFLLQQMVIADDPIQYLGENL